MTKDYLLEVGMEEIPARFLTELSDQLKDKVEQFLTDNRLTYDDAVAYSTPRRLAVIVKGIAERQEDVSEKVKGPALRIAQDEEGEWSKAAQGFVRGQKLTVDDIFIEQIKDEDYIFVNKHTEGLSAKEVLANMADVLNAMTFPVSMTWNSFNKSFIRPVHWIVSLLDDEVVPFSFINIEAGNTSTGHRFLGGKTEITSPNTYVEKLRDEFVLVDSSERKDIIIKQIEQIASDNHWNVPMTEDLLDEVTALVEWPTTFFGQFEDEYLEIPQIVLITAMRDHQRYFYALEEGTDTLLPYFISVRNGDDNHIENVIKGNKKVLKARLEDALFFYKEDMTHDLAYFTEKLGSVKEHFKLGTLAEKQKRVEQIVNKLAETINEPKAGSVASEAAKIYKFDLMTQVVNEFDELQGRMGEIYAKEFGVSDEIAHTISQQYMPTSSGGELPGTLAGAMLAFADKFDTLLNYFNIGLIPTGSNDPYALRRQAMGMVEISEKYDWNFDMHEFVKVVIKDMDVTEEDLIDSFIDFIKLRIQQFLEKEAIDYDIIQAELNGRHANVYTGVNFARGIQKLKNDSPEEYRNLVESLTRVVNLGVKENSDGLFEETKAQTESEQKLFDMLKSDFSTNREKALDMFVKLSDPIADYFNNNMVNDDNEAIRENRLKTMKFITDKVLKFIDPRELNSKF